MSGRAKAERSAARWRSIWRKHDRGLADAAIARLLNIDESTVRYYIRKGRPGTIPAPKTVTIPPVVPDHSPGVVPFRRRA